MAPSTASLTRARTFTLAGVVAVLAACHRGAAGTDLLPETQYAAAMRAFRSGHFRRAQEAFTRLSLDLPPRDTLAPQVRFYLAESHAGLGDFVTATREFRRVADDYPAAALAPYGLLRAADTYARMWRTPELDPSNGQTAMAVYQELLGRYPDSPATQLAGVRLRALQEKFARKDYENGLFYFRRRAFDSAILYFRSLIASYPSASVVPQAFIKLVQAYRAIGYREEQEETCTHLRQYFGTRRDVREACGDGSAGR
jgi:outer membrane protein assembly factor BamD